MNSEQEIKDQLRSWIARKNGRVPSDSIADSTPIIEQRIITSMEVLDLIMYIESLGALGFDVSKLTAKSFKSIDAIYDVFFNKSLIK